MPKGFEDIQKGGMTYETQAPQMDQGPQSESRYAKTWIKPRPRWNGEQIKREFNSGEGIRRKIC